MVRARAFDCEGSLQRWLGVSFYLTREVVFDTLRSIVTSAARGSTLVFDYLGADAFAADKAAQRVQRMQQMARMLGEPMKAGVDPLALAGDLALLGLQLEANLDPAAIGARYFQGRTDRYRPIGHFHYARAVVA